MTAPDARDEAVPPRAPAAAACHRPLEEARRRLEEETWKPLRRAVAEARRAHRGCREAAGFAGDAPFGDAVATRDVLLGYLDAVAERVHGPLGAVLDETRPLAGALTRVRSALDECVAGASDLPAATPLEEAAGGQAASRRAPDGALRRLALRLRGSGSDASVPLAWIARRHVRLRLARGTDRWAGLVAREWAVWQAELEMAWARWAGAALRALPPPGTDGARSAEDAWAVTTAAAETLEGALARLEERCPLEPLAAEMAADLSHWEEQLAEDVEMAGTFLLRTGSVLPVAPRARTDDGAWGRWEGEVVDRFRLHTHLLETASGLPALATRVVARLGVDLRSGWRREALETADRLEAAADRLSREGAEEALERVRTRVDALLEALAETRPTESDFQAAAEKAADSAVASLQSLLRGFPETLVLHPPVGADELPRGPSPQGRSLRLREMARNAFDALRIERVRTVPAMVVPAAGPVAEALAAPSEVVAFGFDSAVAEREEEADSEADARARVLAAEALTRGAEALRTADEPMERALEEARTALGAELHAGSGALLERALADRLEGTILEARSRLATAWQGLRARGSAGFREADRSARSLGRRLRTRLTRLARRGRDIVVAKEEVGVGTGRLLSAPDEVLQRLPLVYQRLFSWGPVDDETLLAGREAALAEAARRWIRWQHRDGVPLLVTGRPGVGSSSFVRVFAARVEAKGGSVASGALDHRITDEGELVAWVSKLLGLPDARAMDALAAAILESPDDALPRLVMVEDLEHLYLREPGGTDLLERLLTLMSETEPRLFWMGTVTSSAWQLLEASEPTAVSQVDRLDLPTLDAEALRDAVLVRHRRSGVPLAWEEPAEGRRLFRRRLARARGQEARDELLERDFFERLHRTTRGNLRLAYFQWLRAADFEAREGTLTVRPRRDLDLTFLDALPPTTLFTLKAFLEHGTLTLAEHDRIFRMPRQESYQVFEALGNRHVIEIVAGSDTDQPISEVVDSARYRINPLLVGAVAAVLAGRNIVH